MENLKLELQKYIAENFIEEKTFAQDLEEIFSAEKAVFDFAPNFQKLLEKKCRRNFF